MENKENLIPDEEQRPRIKAFLKANKTSLDLLTPRQIKLLTKVDSAIQKRITDINAAKHLLKTSKINIASIASDLDIQRQTIYNNELVKKYIDQRSTFNIEYEDIDAVEHLHNDIEALQNKIRAMVLRDVKEADYIIENENLLREIAELRQQVARLTEQHSQDIAAINKIKLEKVRTVYVLKDEDKKPVFKK